MGVGHEAQCGVELVDLLRLIGLCSVVASWRL